MRVALLSPTYWPEVRRGTERMVHDLAVGLAAAGHTPQLLTSHPGRLPTRSVDDGVPILRLPRPGGRAWQRAGFGPHTAHLPLEAIALAAGRPDVAHAFYPTDAAVASAWGRLRRRPTVFSVQGVPSASAMRAHPRTLALWQRAARDCDALLALSGPAADATEAELGVRPRVIPPAVDMQRFRPAAARHPQPTILCAAALDDPRKRTDLLLAAFALVRRSRPDARLVVDRPRRDGTVATGEGVEICDLSTDGLPESYSAAWVSALASAKEAFGLVLAEALACGTPAVGAAEGGAGEIIDSDAVGRVFAGDTPEAVADALLGALDLAADPTTAAACRKRAGAFSVERLTAAHIDLYTELLEARR